MQYISLANIPCKQSEVNKFNRKYPALTVFSTKKCKRFIEIGAYY